MMESNIKRHADLYRMVTKEHICPYGLKAFDLLKRQGFEVHDHHLTTNTQIEAFKRKHNVNTTPQIFYNDQRIGGYDELVRYFGGIVKEKDAITYIPVIALFVMSALIATAVSWGAFKTIPIMQTGEWFIAIAMCLLALQKLKDIDSFTTMFLNYDLLAQRWVPYATFYPFAEAVAGLLMLAGVLIWLSVPLALFIGSVGAISVFKAVYIDQRDLKCACVGGESNVPLGFVSLTENLMMIAMALWMAFREISQI